MYIYIYIHQTRRVFNESSARRFQTIELFESKSQWLLVPWIGRGGSSVRLVVPTVPHQVTLEIHESFDTHFSNERDKLLAMISESSLQEVSFLSLLLLPSSFSLFLFCFHSFLLSLVFLPSFRCFCCSHFSVSGGFSNICGMFTRKIQIKGFRWTTHFDVVHMFQMGWFNLTTDTSSLLYLVILFSTTWQAPQPPQQFKNVYSSIQKFPQDEADREKFLQKPKYHILYPKDHWTLKSLASFWGPYHTPPNYTGSFTRNHWRVLQILRVPNQSALLSWSFFIFLTGFVLVLWRVHQVLGVLKRLPGNSASLWPFWDGKWKRDLLEWKKSDHCLVFQPTSCSLGVEETRIWKKPIQN